MNYRSVGKYILFMTAIIFIASLVGCQSSEAPESSLTAITEEGEEVVLTNKERATILFHFTGAG